MSRLRCHQPKKLVRSRTCSLLLTPFHPSPPLSCKLVFSVLSQTSPFPPLPLLSFSPGTLPLVVWWWLSLLLGAEKKGGEKGPVMCCSPDQKFMCFHGSTRKEEEEEARPNLSPSPPSLETALSPLFFRGFNCKGGAVAFLHSLSSFSRSSCLSVAKMFSHTHTHLVKNPDCAAAGGGQRATCQTKQFLYFPPLFSSLLVFCNFRGVGLGAKKSGEGGEENGTS